MNSAVEALYLATHKTSRLSRRIARALHAAQQASARASKASGDPLDPSGHTGPEASPPETREARASKLAEALAAQASAAANHLRAATALNPLNSRCHNALDINISANQALDDAVQYYDGYICSYLRSKTDARRNESHVALTLAENLLIEVASFLEGFKDPAAASDLSSPLGIHARKLIKESENADASLRDIATAISSDVDGDEDPAADHSPPAQAPPDSMDLDTPSDCITN